MKTTGRLLALALALSVLLAGCTGGDGGKGGATPSTGTSGSTGQPGGPVPVESGPPTRGTYVYENAGLHVTLSIEGTSGTMEVDNATGHDLDGPSFYILDARDGHEIDGTVATPTPVPDGATKTFAISFEGIEVRNIGAIALLFGADNYGLFVRTA